MASPTDKDASCANDPNFAIICGFFEKFSEVLQIKHPNFQQLQEWIANTDEVPNGLRDLHIKLLRKTRKTVHESAWETALSKFCYTYSHQDAWEIERFGYKKSSLKVKLKILRELVEAQFERNANFRSKIMSFSADALRFKPIGRDRLGHSYWVTQDNDTNLRVYQEHLDEEIWQVVATSREEFVTLINRLKGNEVVLPSEIGAIDEDSSSNSCQAALDKPPPPEERDDSQDDDTNNVTTKIPNIKIKLGTQENGLLENRIEKISSPKVLQLLQKSTVSQEKVDFEKKDQLYNEKEEESDFDEEENNSKTKKEDTLNRKVKPLLIKHSKVSKMNEDKPKKRLLDAQDIKLTEELTGLKKYRPTLLDTKREKKISRYENFNDESDEEGEDDEEEEVVEDEEDDDDPEEEDEEEADAESEFENEEEDRDESKKHKDMNNIVSEPIEEEVLIIKGEGMGEECEGQFCDHFFSRELLNYCYNENENDEVVSEAIEGELFVVCGEGSGADCLVGNTRDETEPKATFFFGQPGCLKLSPVKKSPTLGSSSIDSIKESVALNKSNDDITIKNGDSSGKTKTDLEECQETLQNKNEIPEVSFSNVVNILKNDIEIQNDIKALEVKPTSTKFSIEESSLSVAPLPNLLRKTDQLALLQSRKRCLNEKISEPSKSETDGNIEKHEHNDEVGGKRQKMRCKIANTTVRKKIEAKRRKTKEESSSSEEEKLSQQKNIKTNVWIKKQNVADIAKNSEKEFNTTMSKESVLASDSEKNLENHKFPSIVQNKDEVFFKGTVNENPRKTEKLCTQTELCFPINFETGSITDFGESNGDLCEKPTISIQLKEPISESSSTKLLEEPLEIISKTSVKQDIMSQKLSSDQEMKNNREPSVGSISPGSMHAINVKGQVIEDVDSKLEINQIIPEMGNKSKIETKSYDENYKNYVSKEESLSILEDPIEKKCFARSTRSGRRSCAEVPVELTQKKRTRTAHKLTADLSTAAVKCKKSDAKDVNEKKTITSIENIKVVVKFEEPAEIGSKNEIESKDILCPSQSVTCLPTLVTPKKTGIGSRKKQEVDTKNIIDADSETPVRQSRRIAQLKIREEADRRKLEEVALKKMKDELKKKKKAQLKEIVDDPTVSEPTQSEKDENSEEEEEIKKKIEKQKKKGQKKNGWSSGSEDPEEEEEVEEHYYESDPGSPLFKSDHEFSPESDVEDESQMVPMKRARTARQEGEDTLIDEGTDEACIKCGKKDHPEWILLCDKCDKGYHCSCLSPVLFYIPEGDWFCPPCQQEQLIGALELHLIKYDELVIRRKQEEQDRMHTLKLQEEQKQREFEEELMEQEREKESARKQKTESCRNRNRNYRKGSKKKSHRGNRQSRKRRSSVYDKEDSNESGTDSRENSNKSNGTASSYSSKSSNSNTSTSSSVTDSDDEPIYKLRKRRQINVSYRLHEYDDLLKSALKEEVDEVAAAGNLGRGKNISNIVDAESDASEKSENKVVPKVLCNVIEPKRSGKHIGSDSGNSYGEETIKRKPKMTKRSTKKKKSRKLNALDVSSEGDNDSDEDFKTSSFDDDEEEDDSISISTNSDSSLEMFRRRNKGKKKTRRAARHSARERRKVKKFVVEDSDESDLNLSKLKKKKKVDSDYSESETNDDDEDISDEIDSEALCDDSTDSNSAWRPGKRKKQPTSLPAKKEPRPKPKVFVKQKKENREDENERCFKHSGVVKKKKIILDDEDDENDTSDSGRRTRGKRFTYLEDYEEDSSDGGIKPGVKRPDTPPEEREQFIKKQEEIKRMLAEKNTEAARAAATPTLTPIKAGAKCIKGTPEKLDSLSTVPLSVIRQAKALDVDYLQRKGESVSDVDGETDFDDDDLPDDFNPEDMDEEAIVRIMEEEDFANQQPKLVGDSVTKQKKLKDSESTPPKHLLQTVPSASSLQQKQQSLLQEPMRKRLPMPTLHPPLLRNPGHSLKFSQQHMVDHQLHQQQPYLPLLQNALTTPLGQPMSKNISQVKTISPTQQTSIKAIEESNKPRGRRKKITPLRDPLEKQKAAEAVTAAAVTVPPSTDTILSTTPLKTKSISQSIQIQHSKATGLSVAQPPQLYKPPSQINTHPSVITRMSHLPARQPPPGSFSEQRTRIYPPNHLIGHRPQLRQSGLVLGPMPLHHNLRPSYAAGPPPLRQVGDPRHTPPQRHQQYRLPPDQYPPPRPRLGSPLINQYRPTIYGNPQLYPPGPAPLQSNQQGNSLRPVGPSDYLPASQYGSGPYGYYPSPPPLSVQQQHSNNQSTIQSSGVPSSVIVAAPSLSTNLRHQSPANLINKTSSVSPSVVMALPANASRISNITEPRKKLMTLETFNSKLTPPLTDTSSRSPYSSNVTGETDHPEDDSSPSPQSALATESTSEFSGLVSYFSSQQDDFNT